MRAIQKLQPLFIALAFILLVLLLRSQWDELSQHTWHLNPGWLIASASFLLAAWALEIQIWRQLLRVIGVTLAYGPALRIWFLSAIVRYVPGSIWQPLSMTLLCQRRGIAPEATLTSVLLYQVLVLLAATPIAALYVGLTGNWGLLTGLLHAWTPWLVAAGLAPVAVFVVRPSWLIDLVNWLLAKFNRQPLTAGLTRASAMWLLLLAIFDWLLWGACFALLAFALQDYTAAEILQVAPHLVASYAIAYAIGLITLITPSGLGVREGAFYLLLAPLLGGGVVTVVALAMRVWTTLGELLVVAICLLFPDKSSPTRQTPAAVEAREGAP